MIPSAEELEHEQQARDSYGWDEVIKDLALLTPLVLREASEVVYVLRSSRIHPYDVFPSLKEIFLGERSTHTSKAYALLALMSKAP